MKAESLISDKVIDRGIVSPEAAARGFGDVKLGFESRYVLSGLAWLFHISFVIAGIDKLGKDSFMRSPRDGRDKHDTQWRMKNSISLTATHRDVPGDA